MTVSCEKRNTTVPGKGMTLDLFFHPRECNVVDVFLVSNNKEIVGPDIRLDKGVKIEIDVNEAHLPYDGGRMQSTHALSQRPHSTPDLHVENQIRDALNQEYEAEMINYFLLNPDLFGLTGAGEIPPIHYEYRTEMLESLSITADKPLFGQAPGSLLNDRIVCVLPMYEKFVFSSGGALVERMSGSFSIDEYLSFSPMCFSTLYCAFLEMPLEAPLEDVRFTVEVKIKGKEPMSATTEPVTLVP